MAGTAAVAQPAHQRMIASGHLHPIDAEVAAVRRVAAGPLRDDDGPGDERRGLAGPAGLDRKGRQVDFVAFEHDLLHRCPAHGARTHGGDRLEQRQQCGRLAPTSRRFGLAQEREGLADFAQAIGRAVHAQGHALDSPEQIDQHRRRETTAIPADRVLEQHRRSRLGKQAGLDFGHFEVRRNRLGDPDQLPVGFETLNKVAQTPIGHMPVPSTLSTVLPAARDHNRAAVREPPKGEPTRRSKAATRAPARVL